ncbi:MJ0042 family finger-like domain-containing protein [Pseudovibrio ascidiaceicola]|uniref:MJ0042 family finger-like domain-containing protein n=1 Tax=Pseudovibrio ascidiaceicola TaxID=285279 RepID=A0A1I3V7W7_9HYPH|nr:zinc-ribbon domain-containing protein [Pseudovibrio ascidiaceicola]SFJ91385.1 MJ0042 family finger-like domain-containing protein [Pseudovibrio ascidiaceicola]
MKIICPQCNTAYEIPTDKIGDTGRKVKCASCNHIWQVTPEVEDDWATALDAEPEVHNNSTPDDDRKEPSFSESFDEKDWAGIGDKADRHEAFSEEDLVGKPKEEPSDSSGSMGEDTSTQSGDKASKSYEASEEPTGSEDDKSDEKKKSEGTSQKSNRRSRKKTKSSRKSGVISAKGLLGASLLAASLALCFSAVHYRESIVRTFPDLAGLYQLAGMTVNLRGLVFKDLRTFREVDDGFVVLVVEGSVENITRSETYIPAIKLALRSLDTQEIHSWIVEPREDWLAPGDKTRFRARLNNPPERAADIQLRFVERQKKRASIR